VDGRNVLTVAVGALPEAEAFEEAARVAATLSVRGEGVNAAPPRTLCGIVCRPLAKPLPGGGLGDPATAGSPEGEEEPKRVEATAQRMAVERGATFPAPHATWAWLKGPAVEADKRAAASLLDEVRRLHAALQKKDKRLVQGMTAQRARELAIACHVDEQAAHEMLGLLRRMDDKERKVSAFRVEGMRMEVFGNGRLARLADEDGDGPISFVVGDGALAEYVKATFCKDERGRWLMVR
jgi:hypothetical protein